MLERISDTIGIELVDKGFPTEIENRRSIKLKEITHKKTTELWAEFLVWQKEQKQQEETTAVEEKNIEENSQKDLEIKAKIEEKVNILSREAYESVIGMENRALKLKNRMIVKLNLRSGIIYSEGNIAKDEVQNNESEEINEPVAGLEEENYYTENTENIVVEQPEENEIQMEIPVSTEETRFEMPEPLRDDNIIITPDREEMPIEEPNVASENIESNEDEMTDLDSIKITKNSQRIANIDVELPKYEEQEEIQESTYPTDENSEEENIEENIITSIIENPNIRLNDVFIKDESFISPMPEFDIEEENKFEIEKTTEDVENDIEEYVSEENQLNEEEQEEINSALNQIEEETNYNEVELPEDNNDINMLLQQLQEWKENKNKVQKELEETYIEIENSEQEKNSAKERLSRAIEALKEDCKEDERKAEENRDIIKSNEATVNAILSAIDMNK